jgi:hypothetical protein
VSDAGTYCRRVPNESNRVGRDGGWFHPNDNQASYVRPAPHVVQKPPAPVADRHTRDAVYHALLRSLILFTPHRENLQARGLDELSIACGHFKSTPTDEEAERITTGIAEDCDLSGIAGFYKDSSGWKLVKVPSGFFIPILDRDGLIQGLQVRRDILRHPKDTRYTWLSSRGYSLGTSSGAPVHIQNPERITASGKCIISEGALKVSVASQYLSPDEGGLIGLAGVSTFQEQFGQQLKSAWPNLHTATIAFDTDWREKKEVKHQLHRLMRALKLAGFDSITVRTWEHEKGIDDYLISEMEQAA